MASTQKLELILSYLAATVYMNLEELPLNLLSRLYSQSFNDESCVPGEEGLRGYQRGLFFFNCY